MELRNKYSELYSEDSDATAQFEALVKAKYHAAETVLLTTPKGKRDSNNPAEGRKSTNLLTVTHSTNQRSSGKGYRRQKMTGTAV